MIRTTGRALLVQDGQVLAIKYQEDCKVYYALPGGGQNPGEPLHSNLQRECREELGACPLIRIMPTISTIYGTVSRNCGIYCSFARAHGDLWTSS